MQLRKSCSIYREQGIKCSHTRGQISQRSLVILISISPDAKIVGNPHQVISTYLLEEIFPRRVQSRQSQLLPPWQQSLQHVMRYLTIEYGCGILSLVVDSIERSLKLFYDNKLVVLYSNNNRSSTKSKHIGIKFLVIKERVQSGQVSIEYIGTNSMVVGLLTKGLPPKGL